MSRGEGAWIFLSHSNHDFDQVRLLRNSLEEDGHRPLMFFLKALEEHEEIFELVKREISARSWFILCDSENARASRWVREEQAIIKALPPDTHTYQEISLDDPAVDLLQEARRLTRRASVYLSYMREDEEVARMLTAELKRNDFGVFFDVDNLRAGDAWEAKIREELEACAKRGAVLILVSEASAAIQQSFQNMELSIAAEVSAALGRTGNIIPIYIGGRDRVMAGAKYALPTLLESIHGFDLLSPEDPAALNPLMAVLRSYDWEGEPSTA